jgi:signal transduction histidine kinase
MADPRHHLVLPEAAIFFVLGLWLLVLEALANATKHAEARSVRIQVSHAAGMLRAVITDDGAGGADPGLGPGSPDWSAGSRRLMASWR